MNARTSRRALGLALTGALLAAAPASADSLAYVKGGDLFLSTTDGARQLQVTTGGGYSTVSQADDGRLVALKGTRIVTLDRTGKVLHDIPTPVSDNREADKQFHGPYDPVVSPDGKKVAYTYYFQYIGQDPYCNPSTGCYTKRLYQGTAFTAPERLTAWDEPGFMRQSGWIHASWAGNDDVVLSEPPILPNEDVVVASPTRGSEGFRRWYVDNGNYGSVREAVVSGDRSALAHVGEKDGQKLILMSLKDRFHPEYPLDCFTVTEPEAGPLGEAKFVSPTWNGDGTKLFWQDGKGIHGVSISGFREKDACGKATSDVHTIVEGGALPAWGKADVPVKADPPVTTPTTTTTTPQTTPTTTTTPGTTTPATTTTPGTTTPTGGKPGTTTTTTGTGGGVQVTPTPGTDQPGGSTIAPVAAVSVTAAKLKTALAKGLVVRLTGAKAGRHALQAKAGKAVVATGSATVKADGTGTVTLKFTKAGRKALRGKVTVKLVVSGAGATRTVTLKR